MSYVVELTVAARSDLRRIFNFTFDRESTREGGDPASAQKAVDTILRALRLLERAPFSYRRVEGSVGLRELVIPSGGSGFLAAFEIIDDARVRIVAIQHQREERREREAGSGEGT